LTDAGLPVPPGFVVTAGTYRSFIEEAEIDEELFAAVDVDADDSSALADAADRAQELILETPFPDELREAVLESYRQVDADGANPSDRGTSSRAGEAFVAVRSSATAEDLPDASFAGQQETFLNVTEENLLDRVRECWASLFTQRAIYYRQEQGFDHSAVNIAVVVQKMVDAEKSGVMFTSHPSTGDPTMIIEAAWGLGEAVVSGAVSPDNYVVECEDRSIDVTVAEKKVMHEKDGETGETVESEVPQGKRNERVLSDDEIGALMDLGERVEDHYGEPQDVEWAIVDGGVYILQSRPIITIDEDSSDAVDASEATGSDDVSKGLTDGSGVQAAEGGGGASGSSGSGEVIVDGLGSSPGTVSGPARIVTKLDDLAKVGEGDIIVTEMTMPDMVPAMKRASGIITDEGGMTSHAAIVSRELGVPAIVGTTNATTVLKAGQLVTLDGDKGAVLEGSAVEPDEETEPVEEVRPQSPVKPMTATEVKVNVSILEAAERAAATGADGVGLLRMEHMILSLNQTPAKFIEENGEDVYITELVEGIRGVADEFYPRPVRVRTLDAPTDEFRQLEGGEDEPNEHNPMLGYRGIRRSLDRPNVFAHELEAFRRLYEMGYDNVEIMLPLVNDAEDIYQAKSLMKEAGIDPEKRRWGAMIETPAAALSVEEMARAGIDFASFGTNDLTQYTLAVDRNNEHVADRFDELHSSILKLIGDIIETSRDHDVDTSICGQAGSKPEMVQFLAKKGVTSISANIDAVRDVQHEVKRVEQKLLLESRRTE
jgi:pyruvate,water dikinase